MVKMNSHVVEEPEEAELGGIYRHSRAYNSTDMSTTSDNQPIIIFRPNSNSETGKENVVSLCIAFCVLFYFQTQSTLYTNSLWPFLLALDPDVTESFHGFIFTLFYFAGAASAPLFGKLSNRSGAKLPIICGLIITAAGCIFFPLAHLLPIQQRKWAILASRMISGLGVGSRSSIFAYSMEAFGVSKRGKIVAARTIVQSFGLMLGPLLQTATMPVGYDAFDRSIIRVNMYTVPAFISFATSMVAVVVMLVFFQDLPMKQPSVVHPKSYSHQKIDKCALWISSMVRTVQLICYDAVTSISSPLVMVMFNWTDVKTIWFNSILFALQSILVIPTNLFIGAFALNFVRERALMLLSPLLQILAFLIAFPWPWYPSLMSTVYSIVDVNQTAVRNNISHSCINSSDFVNDYQYLEFATMSNDSKQSNSYHRPFETLYISTETCSYSWCEHMPIMYVNGFVLLIVLMFVSSGAGKVPGASLYANMLGPLSQGAWQGVYASMEMLGHAIGPLISGVIFQYYGPQVLFAVSGAIACSAMVPFLYHYKRMISWYEIEGNEEGTCIQKRIG